MDRMPVPANNAEAYLASAQEWRRRCEVALAEIERLRADRDRFGEALELIRDGDGDPKSIATVALRGDK